jgi:NADH dehydrogenase FAD-containing subunit
VTGRPALPPFRYFDKGTMAVVGQDYAVLQTGREHQGAMPTDAQMAQIFETNIDKYLAEGAAWKALHPTDPGATP